MRTALLRMSGNKLRFEPTAGIYLAPCLLLKHFQAGEPGTYGLQRLNPVLEVPLSKTMHFHLDRGGGTARAIN